MRDNTDRKWKSRLSALKPVVDLHRRLRQELDSGLAIVGAAYTEFYMTQAMYWFLRSIAVGSRSQRASSTAAKALLLELGFDRVSRLGLALGFLEQQEYEEVDLLRQIRNCFAHRPEIELLEDLDEPLQVRLRAVDSAAYAVADPKQAGMREELEGLVVKLCLRLEVQCRVSVKLASAIASS